MEEPSPLPLAAATPLALALPASSCESSSPEIFIYDHDRVTDLQLKWIIKSDLPFHIFDCDHYTELIQECLQPQYERVSTTTLLRRAYKLYVQAKKDLIKYFENFQSKVCLTIHAWKNPWQSCEIPYTCITCHWMDPGTWKMSKRIISLEQYEEIYDVIVSSICDFNLKEKVMSITIDNSDGFYTADMKRFKREVKPMFNGVLFHTKCACHILNSMVKSSLDYVAPVITKFGNLCAYVFYYHAKEFRKFLRAKGAKFSHIGLNIQEDWNTTYTMLGRMVKQRLLLVEYYASCGDSDIDIDDNDWETIESLLGILKVFHSSIIRLSDAYYPTTPLVLEEILLIAHMFKEYKQKSFWEPAILEMQSKLLQYYETMPAVFTCAAALNPKYGLNGVENILEDIEGYLGLDTNSDYAKVSMTKCSDALHEVFDYYDKMCRSRSRARDLIMESGSRNVIMESVSRKTSRSVMISNELELYKKTDFLNIMGYDEYENLNMLEWWRNKGRHQYPILAEVARDILTVQASTIPLEFAFCLNGRVLDEPTSYKMSQLSSPKSYEVRIFLKEHFDANDQGKEKVNLVEDDDESEDVDFFSDSSDEEMSLNAARIDSDILEDDDESEDVD